MASMMLSSVAGPTSGAWPGPAQAISSSDRSGMRITMSSPSEAAPRYGATSGSTSRRLLLATKPSRMAMSRVARTTQSPGEMRFRTKRSEPRSSRPMVEPAQSAFGRRAVAASPSPLASRS